MITLVLREHLIYTLYLLFLQALESEINSRDPVVAAIASRAQQMIHSGHFAASKIESGVLELQEQFGHLKDLASVRKLRLLDAVESQMVSW